MEQYFNYNWKKDNLLALRTEEDQAIFNELPEVV